MVPRSLVLSLLALLVTGCSSTTTPAPLSADNPGSPLAEVGVMAAPSETLSASSVPPPMSSDARPSMPAGHQMSGNQPVATQAAASAQYVCPMHADVTSDKPGKCPKCGMTLVKKAGEAANSGGDHHGH